jgi:16S rRNA (uracil1498-N3)-methyltransferase
MIPRLLVSFPLTADQSVPLDTEASHYLVHVLRCTPGTEVVLCDGRGNAWQGRLDTLVPQTTVLLHTRLPDDRESPLDITLIQAMVKPDAMELIVQKWVELGGNALIPLIARRSVVRPETGRGTQRQQRWQRIAREATEQCERTRLPVLHAPMAWSDLIPWLAPEPAEDTSVRLVLQERMPDPVSIGTWARIHTIHGQPAPRRVMLLVGPEGGFTADEVTLACQQLHFAPVTLGPRILRAETAAIVALTMIQALWGDLQ